jgi:hypothetical protein
MALPLRSWTSSLAPIARCVVRMTWQCLRVTLLHLTRCRPGELMLKSLGQPFLTDADASEANVWQL